MFGHVVGFSTDGAACDDLFENVKYETTAIDFDSALFDVAYLERTQHKI